MTKNQQVISAVRMASKHASMAVTTMEIIWESIGNIPVDSKSSQELKDALVSLVGQAETVKHQTEAYRKNIEATLALAESLEG